MFDWLTIATTGLSPLIAHYSFAVVGVAACLAFSYFSPWNKSWGLWGAGIIIAGTICYGVGVSNGESRIKAQWKAAEAAQLKSGRKARTNAVRSVGSLPAGRLRDDRYDRDNR